VLVPPVPVAMSVVQAGQMKRAMSVPLLRRYLNMGIVAPAHASIGRWHAIAQRTQWMQRHGLVGEIRRERLLEMIEEQRADASLQAREEPEAVGAPSSGNTQGSLFGEEGLLLEADSWFGGVDHELV